MVRVAVPAGMPGIRSLFAFRPETGKPLQQLAEQLLRGSSPLSRGERELIAATVSTGNDCEFCARSHGAVAAATLGDEGLVEEVRRNPLGSARITDKMRALLAIALEVRAGGQAVTDAAVERARQAGAGDVEIHDTVLIAAAFCMFNRYVDGLAAPTPHDDDDYRQMGAIIASQGYVR